MILVLLRMLFYGRAKPSFTEEEIRDFDRIYEHAMSNGDGLIRWDTPYPKHRFIDYMTGRKKLVAHGSNAAGIERFETREQALFSGRPVEAVFASKDGIWPIFFAVLDRGKLAGGFRNGCIQTKQGARFYFFSLNRETMDKAPWTRGCVYLLPSETFERSHAAAVYFDEWVSKQAVRAVLRLEVSPVDFAYANRVAVHGPHESILKTWLLYKWRTRGLKIRPGAANSAERTKEKAD